MTILGTRPEIIKLSAVIPLMDKVCKHVLVHTGQHYDYEMDKLFFEELELKNPDYNLEVGSHSHAVQTAKILIRLEPIMIKENPDIVVVQGDTNTALAGALTTVKLQKKLAHVESGCRSGNSHQPEEINRILVDHMAQILFAPDEKSRENLYKEGIETRKITLAGSTAYEAAIRNKQFIRKSSVVDKLKLDEFVLLTVHRAENTQERKLRQIISAINRISSSIKVVFPVHPRTKKALTSFGIKPSKNVYSSLAVGYVDFLNLLSKCLFVMTDSGGIQEEASVFNKPCLVLRNETEWSRLTDIGKNLLVGTETAKIVNKTEELINNREKIKEMGDIPYNYDKDVSKKIVSIIKNEASNSRS
jgi:UDP-N-acetylglucosamine 2-epimerase (non-hydrolysing)